MLITYLNQDVTIMRPNGMNIYGEYDYIQIPIKCRIVDKFKQITNDKGEMVVSSGIVQTDTKISINDKIENRRVIAVNSMTSLDGVIGYKGYLL